MFPKQKGWFGGSLWKPKNPHSLEYLKYLYSVLGKNQTVTENNTGLLVETLRSISEILIWGDQNDSTVFDFFLEKNMLSFFIRYLRQKYGRYICVQLLQTLNILFENISSETSVYYLLSNNHINSIIEHKFDFSDEEVMAYYISFLKTLSLKLNKHTIHFFYNEHTNDFALYTEGIKFFNHSESMVRIAVRTITLNVFKVEDKAMLRYIRDRTAAPYFSNLVWFIGNHILDVDTCVRNDADHRSRDRLSDLVAEHLDHLHYLNDILCLNIDSLNDVLTDHLLNRLLIPLYVSSMLKTRRQEADGSARVSSVLSLFLLSQVFLILSHKPLVEQLTEIIFNGLIECEDSESARSGTGTVSRVSGFVAPEETLAETLENYREPRSSEERESPAPSRRSTFYAEPAAPSGDSESSPASATPDTPAQQPAGDETSPANTTDDEKLLTTSTGVSPLTEPAAQSDFDLSDRPYLEAIFNALECIDNDYQALFSLCLLYALGHNPGIRQVLLDSVFMPTDKSHKKDHYNVSLVERLIKIITLGCQPAGRVRLATLEMSILLLKQLVFGNADGEKTCYLQDRHLACLLAAREESMVILRNYYRCEEMFLDMFEDEYRDMTKKPLNVEYLTMDASILLQPTGTPLTGIDFNKRLPCGEVERARRAIRVFFLIRALSLELCKEKEVQLPLTKTDECIKLGDILDLNNSDLIACTVVSKDGKKERRFLVIDVLQLILVEPDTKRLGWGIVKFVGFLQDVEVTGDKEDSRSLHVSIYRPSSSVHARPFPLLAAKFTFDDHIRCMAAKQRLTKGRLKARQRKMLMIARLLDMPSDMMDSGSSSSSSSGYGSQYHSRTPPLALPGRVMPMMAPREQRITRSLHDPVQQSVFAHVDNVPGFQAARQLGVHSKSRSVKSQPTASRPRSHALSDSHHHHHRRHRHRQRSGEGSSSPEVEQAVEATSAFQALHPTHEHRHSRSSSDGSAHVEIPLEDMSRKKKRSTSSSGRNSPASGRSSPAHSVNSPRRRTRASSTSESPVPDQNTVSGQESHGTTVQQGPQDNANTDSHAIASENPTTRAVPEVTNQTVDAVKQSTKPRSHSSPKSLVPHDSPVVSLLSDGHDDKPLPQLLPPTDDQRQRSHSHPVELASTDSAIVISESAGSEPSELTSDCSNVKSMASKPDFCSKEDSPTVEENRVNVDKVEQCNLSEDLDAKIQLKRSGSLS